MKELEKLTLEEGNSVLDAEKQRQKDEALEFLKLDAQLA